jgi:UDP-glucose 4-epimerase
MARALPDNRASLHASTMILLTGATGYIASHTWLALEGAGFQVAGLDDFSNSSPEVLRRLAALGADVSRFARADVHDRGALDALFAGGKIEAVVHFAASKSVGESVAEPLAYYANNVGGVVALAQAMGDHGCKTIVFSSSATVYGDPQSLPIAEGAPLSATNPYGATASCATSSAPIRPGASPCCATSTRSARTRAARSAKTRVARPTT